MALRKISTLVIGLSALVLVTLAAPSGVEAAVCGAQSHHIPYPAAAVDTGRANCLADYPIPYPAADFEGDGISYFVRSSAINSSADTDAYSDNASVELMAFPFEGLNPRGPVANSTAASVELMAFPFEGLNPRGPVANSTAASVELMAFPFEGLNPGGPVANPADSAKAAIVLP